MQPAYANILSLACWNLVGQTVVHHYNEAREILRFLLKSTNNICNVYMQVHTQVHA